MLLSEPTQTSSHALFEQWQLSAAGLGNADPTIEAPLAERSKALREELLAELEALQ